MSARVFRRILPGCAVWLALAWAAGGAHGGGAPREKGSPARTAAPAGNPAVDRIFDRWDASGDGRLQAEEWLRYVRDASGVPFDADEDGLISRQEFLASFLGLNQSRPILYEPYCLYLLWEGKNLAAKGDWAAALAYYRQVTKLVPESLEGCMGQGRCLLRLGQREPARQAFRLAAERAPADAEAWLELALADFELSEPAAGRTHLKRALKLLEDAARIPPSSAGMARELEYTAALLKAVARRLTGAGYGIESKEVLERAGRMRLLGSGAARAGKTVAWPAGAGEPATDRGGLLALRLGELLDRGDELAMRKFLWALDPGDFTQTEAIDLGWQLASRERWGLARAWFRRAWLVPLDQQRTTLLLALCRSNMEDRAGALRLLEGFTGSGLAGSSLLRLAVGLCLKLGLELQAQRLAEEAVWQQPQDLSCRLLLAEVYGARGDPDARARVLRQALAVSPAGLPQTGQLNALVRSLGPGAPSTPAAGLEPDPALSDGPEGR